MDKDIPGHCKQCEDEKLLKICLKIHVNLFMKKTMEFASFAENVDLLKTSLDEDNPGHCKQCKDKKLLKICLKTHVDLFMRKIWDLLFSR